MLWFLFPIIFKMSSNSVDIIYGERRRHDGICLWITPAKREIYAWKIGLIIINIIKSNVCHVFLSISIQTRLLPFPLFGFVKMSPHRYDDTCVIQFECDRSRIKNEIKVKNYCKIIIRFEWMNENVGSVFNSTNNNGKPEQTHWMQFGRQIWINRSFFCSLFGRVFVQWCRLNRWIKSKQ